MNQVDETIEWLFANESKEMKRICNKEMAKFGGIYEMDYHDFYSQVGWDISKARKRFDLSKGKTFKDYIYGVIKLSVYKEMSRRNRGKRQLVIEKKVVDKNGNVTTEKEYIPNISLDAPSDDGIDLCEKLPSDFDVEDEIIGGNKDYFISKKMREYLNNLTKQQRQVAYLIMDGYSSNEIIDTLHIKPCEFNDCMQSMKAYRNISILF